MQQTTEIREGDTLVNDDGTVTITVDAIDGDDVEVTDSRDLHDPEDVTVDQVRRAAESDDFTLVRDSDLTAIKGVGEATAPKLEGRTGCETPAALAEAYLHGDVSIDAIPRGDYFREWLLDNLDTLDLDVDPDRARVFLFLKEHGGSVTDYYDGVPTSRASLSIKRAELSVDHIQWESGGYWPDSSSVMGVGTDDWFHLIGLDPDERVPVDTIEKDGDHYRAVANGGETWLSRDYVESAVEYFDVDIADAMAHPDGEHPVVWDVEDSALSVVIAPRVNK